MTAAPAITTAAASGPLLVAVTLDTPIKRGDQEITKITLRKPRAGELRGGLSLVDLAQLDVAALRKLLPRITTPILTELDVDQLDMSDLMALGAEVSGFLLQKAQRPASLDQ